MIYIDPPYNTGNDFVYSDNYADPIGTYLERTGQSDTEGKTFDNTESDGRFHSNWLQHDVSPAQTGQEFVAA